MRANGGQVGKTRPKRSGMIAPPRSLKSAVTGSRAGARAKARASEL